MSCSDIDHEWAVGGTNEAGQRYLACASCGATAPAPVVHPGAQLVDLPGSSGDASPPSAGWPPPGPDTRPTQHEIERLRPWGIGIPLVVGVVLLIAGNVTAMILCALVAMWVWVWSGIFSAARR